MISNEKQDLISGIKNQLSFEEQIDNKNSYVEDYITSLKEQLGSLKNEVAFFKRKT